MTGRELRVTRSASVPLVLADVVTPKEFEKARSYKIDGMQFGKWCDCLQSLLAISFSVSLELSSTLSLPLTPMVSVRRPPHPHFFTVADGSFVRCEKVRVVRHRPTVYCNCDWCPAALLGAKRESIGQAGSRLCIERDPHVRSVHCNLYSHQHCLHNRLAILQDLPPRGALRLQQTGSVIKRKLEKRRWEEETSTMMRNIQAFHLPPTTTVSFFLPCSCLHQLFIY